jgi:RND family efflux transporter MFP subunit
MNGTKSHQPALALALTVIVAAGCDHASKAETARPNEPATPVARVTICKPLRKTLVLNTTQPARIEAFEETPIFSKLAGYIEKVHVDIGDKVSLNQPLVTLHVPEVSDDVRQKTALVAQAEAQLRQATAAIAASKAAVETADAKVSEAKAAVTRANAEHERWESEYGRVKQLAANGSVTEKLSDETLNQLRATDALREAANAGVRSAEAGAREARVNVEKSQADKAAADAKVNVAKADLARALTMLDYATMRAPFDGVVTRRTVNTGHFVQPASGSGEPLLVVARTDQVRIFVDIPELEAGSVDKGDPATIRIQALPGKTVSAPVTRTSWSLDNTNRSLQAEVDVPNSESLLRPGMYATVTIERDRRNNAIVIPAAAVFTKEMQTFVSCVASGKVQIKQVHVGLRSGQEIEILDGLNEASVIVLTQGDKLAEGQVVEPSNKM